MSHATRKSKPGRRFRFSLRALLIIFALVAAGFAWINYRVSLAREQRLAVESILAGGGGVSYAESFQPAARGIVREGDPFPGNWYTNLLGENPHLQINGAVVGDLQQSRRGLRSYPINGDHNLQFVPQLASIQFLDARGQSVTDAGLCHLQNVTSLQRLNLSSSAITDDGMDSLVHLEQLEILILTGTVVTDAGVSVISQLPKLRTLNLSGTHVTSAVLQELHSLPDLRNLMLDDTIVGGQPPESLSLPRLESLSLARTNVGDEWVPLIVQLQRLKEIDFNGTQLTDAGLLQLAELPNLQLLILGTNEGITEEGRAAFYQLRPEVQAFSF